MVFLPTICGLVIALAECRSFPMGASILRSHRRHTIFGSNTENILIKKIEKYIWSGVEVGRQKYDGFQRVRDRFFSILVQRLRDRCCRTSSLCNCETYLFSKTSFTGSNRLASRIEKEKFDRTVISNRSVRSGSSTTVMNTFFISPRPGVSNWTGLLSEFPIKTKVTSRGGGIRVEAICVAAATRGLSRTKQFRIARKSDRTPRLFRSS